MVYLAPSQNSHELGLGGDVEERRELRLVDGMSNAIVSERNKTMVWIIH